jgi:GNAT superfamily N-acetyltransferase
MAASNPLRASTELGIPRPMNPSDVTIRDATLEDAGELAQLVRLLHEERGAVLDLELARKAAITCVASQASDLIVAVCDGAVVGYVAVLRGQEAYVSDLLIRLDWRGRGIGGRLLAATEQRARTRGCVRLMLNNRRTADSFQRAFYPQAGFVERTDFANFVKPLGDESR